MSETVDGNITLSIDISQHTSYSDNNVRSYQYFIKEFGLSESFDLYIACVLIGKYYVKERRKFKKGNKYGFIKYATAIKKEKITILNALAIEETNDIEILNDVKSMIKIWDEYANAGFEVFCDWYYSGNIDFESTLSNFVLDAYNGVLE